MPDAIEIAWVVLTLGDRAGQLEEAVASVDGASASVLVVYNRPAPDDRVDVGAQFAGRADVVSSGDNLGVPGGRHFGLRRTSAPIVGFLDDDAVLRGDVAEILEVFDTDPTIGAVALRLVDEAGTTARRHTPRAGASGASTSSDVAYFLGGACAIRRSAYEQVGGYFTELIYGHEEIELSWRLIDAGWRIRYLAEVEVFHPRSEISRHADGWHYTGRNRVLIARRTLPWPIACIHVSTWLVLGLVRAPTGCRRPYLQGWMSGWKSRVVRRPIGWRTVWRLARLGRPPVI